jgi:mRNA interferase MazF
MAKKQQPVKRGDVYLAKLLFDDENGGRREQTKFVVILQEGRWYARSQQVAVLRLTTKNLDHRYPTDVLVSPKECGCGTGAKIIADQPQTILKCRLLKYRYSLSASTMQKVEQALALSLGLSSQMSGTLRPLSPRKGSFSLAILSFQLTRMVSICLQSFAVILAFAWRRVVVCGSTLSSCYDFSS